MTFSWILWSSVAVSQPVEPVPEPDPSPLFIPANERFLERDRRSRRAYQVAATVAATGVAFQILGIAIDSPPLVDVAGRLEAVGAPVMVFTSLRSANALDRMVDTPFPGFAYAGMATWAVDLAASIPATSDPLLGPLTRAERRRYAWVAVGGRVATLVLAGFQQRSNNRVRRRLGLRVRGPSPRRRARTVAFSPWLEGRTGGILLQLSDGIGGRGRPVEQVPWTSNP
ncbi:MAG: hypothetical protein AAGA48_07490 [Myxococcota bacterium]